MRRWLLWVVMAFSLVGMAGSFMATHQYYQIQKHGFEQKSFCDINEYVSCETAFASSEAQLAGIPVAWLGFIFYLWMIVLAFWSLKKGKTAEETASFAWGLSLLGLALSVYKAYVSFFVLQVLCLICVSIHVVNIVLFLSWHLFLKIGLRHWNPLTFKPQWKALALWTFLVYAVGLLAIVGYQGGGRASKLDVPVNEIVQFHFRQSEYQIEANLKAPLWGNPSAKVTLIEFSDFQCPSCREAAFRLRPYLSEFRNKIRFLFYNFPLDQSCNDQITSALHDKACVAAQASLCAAKQGDFWGYHDDIFRNQKDLSREMLLGLAQKRGWDIEIFEKCIDAPATLAELKESIKAGTAISVSGTPTLLVNNRRLKYWIDPEVLRAVLREEIKRASK